MEKALAKLKDYFIPHDGNGHRPRILRPHVIAFVALVLVAAQMIFLFGISNLAPRSRLFGIIFTNTLIDETNQNRVANGLSALQESPLLDAAAQDKANDMVKNNYFAHTSPAGLSPWYWFEQVGYNFSSAGENLAVNFSDSDDVTNAWMNSPEHRANILNAGFTQIGMATAEGTFNGVSSTYVVELFGTPQTPFVFIPPAEAAGAPAASVSAAPVVAPAKTKTAAPAAKSAPATAPVVIASSSKASANEDQTFIAVSNVETTTASASAPVPSTPAQATAPAFAVPNPVQAAAADPRHVVDALYFVVAGLFVIALALNTFIKVRVQHADVIFGGLAVLLIAGLFIMFNQHFVLAQAAIL